MKLISSIATLSSLIVVLTASPILWNQTSDEVVLREGDIVVPKDAKSFGLSGKANNWPNGVVPYEIYSRTVYTQNQLDIIKEGMEMLSSKTGRCITFVPRTAEHTTWIKIISGSGCWSYVGKTYTGAQEVSLQKGSCTNKGTVVHELMHAIGFHHEQNRPDRDQHIRVDFSNIDPEKKYNFDKSTGQTFSTPYDLKSIMQYDEYAFSNNGRKTIIPLNGEKLIPQYSKTDAQILTESDISAVRQLYQCSGSIPTTQKPITSITKPADGSPFTLRLINNYDGYQVDLYWINYNDEEIKYGIIGYKESRTQPTFVGHKWLLKAGNGKEVTIVIGQGQVTTSDVNVYLLSLFTVTTVAPTTTPMTTLPLHAAFTFNIKNDSDQTINVYWINANGSEVFYVTIQKGGTYKQASYVGHIWAVKGSGFNRQFRCGRGKFLDSDMDINVSDIIN